MTHPLEQLRDDALREIEAARDEKSLEGVRVKYLGKSGSISVWGEQMRALAKEEKPVVGKLLNEVRNAVTAALEERNEKFRAQKNPTRLRRSTSPFRERRMRSVRCIRSPKCGNARSKFSAEWASRSLTGPTLKTNGIASTRSTRRRIIPRATSRTHFICRMADCCARTLQPCKFARWNRRRRRSG